jgi:hypothetical protein
VSSNLIRRALEKLFGEPPRHSEHALSGYSLGELLSKYAVLNLKRVSPVFLSKPSA